MDVPAPPELAKRLAFLHEVDALKHVYRRTTVMDGSRRENSAEHSWHIALAALVLANYADEPVDVDRVIRLLLVHDVVEIDAGDTFAYDLTGKLTQAAREVAAADRLFGLLPDDQAAQLTAMWAEFEARQTPEARFAHAVDRLLPVLHNFATGGGSWHSPGVNHAMVVERMRPLAEDATALWAWVSELLAEAVRRGYLAA
jgi:putative hydrolase of HD superfamily